MKIICGFTEDDGIDRRRHRGLLRQSPIWCTVVRDETISPSLQVGQQSFSSIQSAPGRSRGQRCVPDTFHVLMKHVHFVYLTTLYLVSLSRRRRCPNSPGHVQSLLVSLPAPSSSWLSLVFEVNQSMCNKGHRQSM